MDLKDKKIAILGFGLEGKDLTDFLLKQNAKVTVFDRKNDSELDFKGLNRNSFSFITGENYLKNGFEKFDVVFRSPGFYRYIPEIVKAEKTGVKISSATNLFFELCRAKIIGVTGTKGKGTTSTLIYEILKKAGKDVYLAGNIGKPMLSLLPKLKSTDFVILELSSFQLIDLKISPFISVVLNITVDHLDWHKNIKEYRDAKKNIVRFQKKSDFAIINGEYSTSRNFAGETKAKVIFFSKQNLADKFKKHLLLKGEHNLENIAAAVNVAKILKINDNLTGKLISNFRGLEHRLEYVGLFKGIQFYNDSFSTNPQTTIAAIKSFSDPITLILGGFDKKLNYDFLAREIVKSCVVNCFLIGDIREKIKSSLKAAGFDKNILDLGYSKMPAIISKCLTVTPAGGIVLLSPASSSFDMFSDYKQRGILFKQAVMSLKKTSK